MNQSSTYYKTGEFTVNFDNHAEVTTAYNSGFVFTRLGKGHMIQTRSLRIDISKFSFTSENRRIMRKTQALYYDLYMLPYREYTWEIHKLGKQYYETKFGLGIMSASKIKDMFTKPEDNSMNCVFSYRLVTPENEDSIDSHSEVENHISDDKTHKSIGYALCYKNENLLHYAYPFYDLNTSIPNLGMGMMLRAIEYSKENNINYVYLGSVTDESAKYKLQFEGLEWWNTEENHWSTDMMQLKNLIAEKN